MLTAAVVVLLAGLAYSVWAGRIISWTIRNIAGPEVEQIPLHSQILNFVAAAFMIICSIDHVALAYLACRHTPGEPSTAREEQGTAAGEERPVQSV